MKVLSVVGARPQFVKLAPVSQAMSELNVEHVVVHTGQHYDERMSDDFFQALSIPEPAYNLGVGSGTHGWQTGAMLAGLDPLLEREQPDWVLVYGDTNSTLAAALSAVKLQLPVAHLEAGLRSFNRRMPEEHNRVLTDHAADLCLAPTQVAMQHLAREGLSERAELVGDVMTDILMRVAQEVRDHPVTSPVPTEGAFLLATLHRAENTDERTRLSAILAELGRLDLPVFLAAHPRLVTRCREFGISLAQGAIRPVAPLGYLQMVQALTNAKAVVTDSGGLQKEAFLMRVPTTTLRGETEWTETLDREWNVLVEDPADLSKAVSRQTPAAPSDPRPFGDGTAARAAVLALKERRS